MKGGTKRQSVLSRNAFAISITYVSYVTGEHHIPSHTTLALQEPNPSKPNWRKMFLFLEALNWPFLSQLHFLSQGNENSSRLTFGWIMRLHIKKTTHIWFHLTKHEFTAHGFTTIKDKLGGWHHCIDNQLLLLRTITQGFNLYLSLRQINALNMKMLTWIMHISPLLSPHTDPNLTIFLFFVNVALPAGYTHFFCSTDQGGWDRTFAWSWFWGGCAVG